MITIPEGHRSDPNNMSPQRHGSLPDIPRALDIEDQSVTSCIIREENENINNEMNSPRFLLFLAIVSALIVFSYDYMRYGASL